jgi:hypothetical protein
MNRVCLWLLLSAALAVAACSAPRCDLDPDGREGGIGGTGACAEPPTAG